MPHSLTYVARIRGANSFSSPDDRAMPRQGEVMKMPWKNEPNILSMLIAFGMTLLGAIASYSFKVLNGEAFSWRTLFLQLFVSIFAGLTMVMIALHYEWPSEIMGGVCGMAGWSGASLIKALERRFLNKASGEANAD